MSKQRWRLLVTAPYMQPLPDEYRSQLEAAGAEIVLARSSERFGEDDLLELIGDVDAVICGDDAFTERVLAGAKRLRVISKWGTGTDSIDREAAERLGIAVRNTPGAFTDAVADTAFGYILSSTRELARSDRAVRAGSWTKPKCASLSECVVGIVGLGNIGKAVARRAVPFRSKLLGSDPRSPDPEFIAQTGIEMTTLDELLAKSDIVTLHCDLNETSYHLIGSSQLAAMPSTAYIVNTSRGPVIDEAALVDALEKRMIAGAGLDVFEIEPLPDDSPFRALDNVMLSPHCSNSSPVAHTRVHRSTVDMLICEMQGEQRRTSAA